MYTYKSTDIGISTYWNFLRMSICIYCVSFHISDSAGTRDTFSERIHVIDLWRGCGLTWLKSCFAAQETLTLRRTSLLLRLGWGLMWVHCGWSKIGGFFYEKTSLARCACQLQVFAFHTPCLRASQGGNVAMAVIDVHVPKGVPEQVWFYSRLAEKVGGLEFCLEIQENVKKEEMPLMNTNIMIHLLQFFPSLE